MTKKPMKQERQVKLRCETEDPEVGDDILAAFEETDERAEHEGCDVDTHFEHGCWWVSDSTCGASWSANDAQTETGEDYFAFEEVSAGDEQLREDARETRVDEEE